MRQNMSSLMPFIVRENSFLWFPFRNISIFLIFFPVDYIWPLLKPFYLGNIGIVYIYKDLLDYHHPHIVILNNVIAFYDSDLENNAWLDLTAK